MSISPATINDIPTLVRLVNSAYRGDTSRKGWTTEANLLGGLRTDKETLAGMMNKKDSVVLKYMDDSNTVIGCVYLQLAENKLYLGMLTVDPEIQSQGIGKKLLASATVYAQEHHCTAIFMTVISLRSELIAWYERHGYKKTGEKKPFPTDKKFGVATQPLEFIVLEKSLTNPEQSSFQK
jgi:ribosomal protein S18 acetylase RimI-like enzyme